MSQFGTARLSLVLVGCCLSLLAGLQTLRAANTTQIAASSSDAMAATEGMVNGALAILADKSAPLADRRERLRALADANLDFASLAHATLGHHWSELTPEQRARFTRVFRRFIEDAYLTRIQDYSGQKVQFLQETTDSLGQAQVTSQWVGGDQPVKLVFMLHQNAGRWKIYDLTVDDVAITSNYRNQFSRVLDSHSFDSLISMLKMKDQQLAESLGR